MQGKRGWSFAVMGVLLGLAAGFAAWGGRPEASPVTTASPPTVLTPVAAPVAGGLAPEFEASGVDGDRFLLSQTRGRIVLLNFWATWCEPCRSEMPLLEARYDAAGAQRVLVVGINSADAQDQIREYRDALKLTFPLVLDPDGKIEALYRVRGYPTTFLVDELGVIQYVHVGGMNSETLDDTLRALGLD